VRGKILALAGAADDGAGRRPRHCEPRISDCAIYLYAVLKPKMHILGISAFYHDSAAALVIDGEVVEAAQEERFTRKKHDSGFPRHAINYGLAEASCSLSDINLVVFYEKPEDVVGAEIGSHRDAGRLARLDRARRRLVCPNGAA